MKLIKVNMSLTYLFPSANSQYFNQKDCRVEISLILLSHYFNCLIFLLVTNAALPGNVEWIIRDLINTIS